MSNFHAAATNKMRCWTLREVESVIKAVLSSGAIHKARITGNVNVILDSPYQKRGRVPSNIETSSALEVLGAVDFLILEPVPFLNVAVIVAIILSQSEYTRAGHGRRHHCHQQEE